MAENASTEATRYRGVGADFALIGRAVRLTFDFAGRSKRTEYGLYAILSGWLAPLAAWAATIPGRAFGIGPTEPPSLLASLMIFLPLPALMARRLHDAGYSARWSAPFLALALFAFALGSIEGMETANLLDNLETLRPHIGWWTTVIGVTMVLFFWSLVLVPPSEENPYGPDPRL